MDLAFSLSKRGTCNRAQVGAILVNEDNIVLGMGYNGAPSGMEHCTKVGCLLDSLGHCRRTIHAEANALIRSGVDNLASELTLYTTHRPCVNCIKLAVARGVMDVIYWIYRRDIEADKFLKIAVYEDKRNYYQLLSGKMKEGERIINVRKATTPRPTKK